MLRRSSLLVFLFVPAQLVAGIAAIRSDVAGFAFRYEPGEVHLDEVSQGQMVVSFADADDLARAGELELPSRVVRVGIPQTGGVRIRVRVGPVQVFDDVTIPRVVPVSGDPVADVEAVSTERMSYAELGEVGRFRDVRFVEVRLHPALYDSETKRLRVCAWVEVELTFEDRPRHNPRPDPLDGPIGGMLLNNEQAMGWKLDPTDAGGDFFERASGWAKVCICSTGIYAVSGQRLRELGVPLSGVDPATIALYTLGEHEPNGPYPDTMIPVPVLVWGEEDGVLDPEDRIVFYALGADHWVGRCSSYVTNYYTRENAYWLAWGGSPGARMPAGFGPDTSGLPAVGLARAAVHQEVDAECPARSGLLWIWRTISKDSYRPAVSYAVDLDLRYPVSIECIRGQMYSDSLGNVLVLRVNRRVADSLVFGTATPYDPFVFVLDSFPPVSLSRNQLTFELKGEGGKVVYLDHLEIEYLRRLSLHAGQLEYVWEDTGTFCFSVRDVGEDSVLVLDVSDPYAPRVCEGSARHGDSLLFWRRILAPVQFCVASAKQLREPERTVLRRPGRLRSRAAEAEYWVLVPAEFLSPAQKLARYRAGRIPWISNAKVKVAVLEDVYDDYSYGLEEPGAVKSFLADKRPVYGLLAGDATYDYRGNLGRARLSGVPAYEVGFSLNPSGTSSREALAYDAWYADFEGGGGSPDMILGRVTARSGEEFGQFVEKVIGYETGPAGNWSRRFILVADDEYKGETGRPDELGFRHIQQTEGIGVLPGNRVEPVKVYLTEYPFLGIKSKPGARAELLRQLKRGALALAFFGHGDAFDLTHESVLNISQIGDVSNGGRMPFCYFGSCSVGRFEDTRYECIAEELVRKPDGGAIAAVGATKATTSGPNEVFARNMLVPLFNSPDSTIGVAFFAAWPTDRIYHLFGDPATRLRLAGVSSQIPVVKPDTLRPGARFRVQSIVEVPSADFSWSLYGPWRVRQYISGRGSISYTLPGIELSRGNGRIRDGRLWSQGVFPTGVRLDTVYVADGFYAPVSRSSRFSALVWNDSLDISVLRDTIRHIADIAPFDDTTGPTVGFWTAGRRLEDNVTVPAELELEGVIADPSGIMIAPVPGCSPILRLGTGEAEVDLSDLLFFDDSSGTGARFRVPVKLTGAADTLWVLAADNFQNRTAAHVVVIPVPFGAPLVVDSVLVYPNPVKGRALFCFNVNHSASVRVRVYTLQGRLVRDLGDTPVAFGYNQMAWDGLDSHGKPLPNGVYLFVLSARAQAPTGEQISVVRDRMVVLR